jgi:hypothetical protein
LRCIYFLDKRGGLLGDSTNPFARMSATLSMPVQQYSIRDIIDYRALPWAASEEFLFLTEIPLKFEPFAVESTY